VFATCSSLGGTEACGSTGELFAHTYAPRFVSLLSVYTILITILNSQVSKAVDTWKADLIGKKHPKIAASLAHPDVNPELFEEG
jgi:coatomer subunit beta'